jgi:hypothetical protein
MRKWGVILQVTGLFLLECLFVFRLDVCIYSVLVDERDL